MKKVIKGCFGCIGVLIVGLLILVGGFYVYYEWIYEEWSTERIERITGIRLPEFDIIESDQGERGFNGDYEDKFTIEFETVPSNELFDEIDKMIETQNTKWMKHDDSYTFYTIWGNGEPAPKGESEDDDVIFSITITKGKKTGEIKSGTW
ncbi:MAG: hypothetical protein IJL35_07335 [Bacteroidaceae bacterium]|nr:hypothetical protein [Bacteroidaceae bacterium]